MFFCVFFFSQPSRHLSPITITTLLGSPYCISLVRRMSVTSFDFLYCFLLLSPPLPTVGTPRSAVSMLYSSFLLALLLPKSRLPSTPQKNHKNDPFLSRIPFGSLGAARTERLDALGWRVGGCDVVGKRCRGKRGTEENSTTKTTRNSAYKSAGPTTIILRVMRPAVVQSRSRMKIKIY